MGKIITCIYGQEPKTVELNCIVVNLNKECIRCLKWTCLERKEIKVIVKGVN